MQGPFNPEEILWGGFVIALIKNQENQILIFSHGLHQSGYRYPWWINVILCYDENIVIHSRERISRWT